MTNKLILAAMLALLSSAPAMAQDTAAAFDSRWIPYVGCWTIIQDQYGQSAPVPAGTMVCVRPSGRFGVAITTTVDGKNVLEQTIVADGSAQPLSQGDCSGTQTSNWSRDGERLFTNVELECANRPKRHVSGITLLANGQWVDAQATVIDGNSDVRLRRYRRTSDQNAVAPAITTAPLTIEDVIEASAKVQSEALEAALDEVNARFALNSRALKQLADNGVSPNVIDLLVAQAYPDKFEVERRAIRRRRRLRQTMEARRWAARRSTWDRGCIPRRCTTRSTAATTTTRRLRIRITGARATAIVTARRSTATITTTTTTTALAEADITACHPSRPEAVTLSPAHPTRGAVTGSSSTGVDTRG